MRIYEHPTRSGLLAGAVNAEVRAVSGGKPVVQYVGSDDKEDRYGSIISPSGWEIEAFLRNPVILWAHDYAKPPIGRALKVEKTARSLNFTVEFATEQNEFAADIYRLISSGFLNGVSVGFIPLASEPFKASTVPDQFAEGIRYTKAELLELSVVPVPANRGALQNAYARGLLRDGTIIQAGRRFKGFLNGSCDMFPMAPPAAARGWEPSAETIAKLESYVRRKNAAEIAKRWR